MIKKFISFYKPYKKLFILDFGCAVTASVLELAFPLIVSRIVDTVLPNSDWNTIIKLCLILAALYIISDILYGIVTYFGHMLGLKIETDMRTSMFDHLQKMSFKFFDNNKTGNLISRISTELFEIGEMAHHGPEDMFIALITLVGSFAIMGTISVNLALITIVVVVFMLTFTLYFNKKMTIAFRGMFSVARDYTAKFQDAISGIRVVQAFSNEKHEKENFLKNNIGLFNSKMKAYRVMSFNGMVNHFFMKLLSVFAIFCGSYFVINGDISYGEFVSFILLINVMLVPLQKINNVIDSYPKGIAGFKGYLEILATDPDIVDSQNAKDIVDVRGDISYKNVCFSYDEDSEVLKNITLDIKSGETVAFVGASGAGKTTLCSLLPRFYQVDSGEISIDGVNINDIKIVSLRKHIGIVQQDVFLFSGTIRENIAYGRLEATEAEILDAAKRSKLDDFINFQKDGLDAVIGERGVKLSGGQKQRLSIARMFLKNPKILILDEATSALDTETELAIQNSLAELSKGRTTLVIAHRLSTIKKADKIIVVTEDGIAEVGKHEELIKQNGIYTRLHNLT